MQEKLTSMIDETDKKPEEKKNGPQMVTTSDILDTSKNYKENFKAVF